MNEPTEARRIIAELETVCDQLKLCDQRLILSWRQYLDRTGDAAQIGSKRLALLRRIHAEYYGNGHTRTENPLPEVQGAAFGSNRNRSAAAAPTAGIRREQRRNRRDGQERRSAARNSGACALT